MSDEPQGQHWWRASDGKWYPPSPPPTVTFAPPPPKDPNKPEWYQSAWAIIPLLVCCAPVGLILVWTSKWNRTAKVATSVIVGGLFVLSLILGALNPSESRRGQAASVGGGTSSGNEREATPSAPDPAKDFISVDTSTLDAIGCTTVEATVKNHTADRASYYIVVSFENADSSIKYGQSSGIVSGVDPGQTATGPLLPACGIEESVGYRVTTFRRTRG